MSDTLLERISSSGDREGPSFGEIEQCLKEAYERGLLAHSESSEIPAELYDGMAVYVALGVEKTKDIRPQMVSDVLDAVVRLIRKNRSGEQSAAIDGCAVKRSRPTRATTRSGTSST